MSGFLVRLRLILALWFTSVYAILLMLLIPLAAYVIYSSGFFTLEKWMSMVYEEAAPIWFILILQWCLSVDFDSKFYLQVMTYPIARWKFLVERLLFSAVIFIGLLSAVAVSLSFYNGIFVWQSFLFVMPVYMAIAGLAAAGTVLGNHSGGGLLAGILFWLFFDFGGKLLGNYNVILLKYGSVYTFVKGETGFWAVENHWILTNRLLYVLIGICFTALAIYQLNRKTV